MILKLFFPFLKNKNGREVVTVYSSDIRLDVTWPDYTFLIRLTSAQLCNYKSMRIDTDAAYVLICVENILMVSFR